MKPSALVVVAGDAIRFGNDFLLGRHELGPAREARDQAGEVADLRGRNVGQRNFQRQTRARNQPDLVAERPAGILADLDAGDVFPADQAGGLEQGGGVLHRRAALVEPDAPGEVVRAGPQHRGEEQHRYGLADARCQEFGRQIDDHRGGHAEEAGGDPPGIIEHDRETGHATAPLAALGKF